MTENSSIPENTLSNQQITVLLGSILLVSLCGIIYQLIIGAISSYLLGNSVYQFSITIGLFMSSMGIGSYLSKKIDNHLIRVFIIVELFIGILGGWCSLFLFYAFLNECYYYVSYPITILIGACIGLEIPILTRTLAEQEQLKDSVANVLSLDYIGGLVGSLLFPLLLLPYLGLLSASFIIGLVNFFVVYINIKIFYSHLKNPIRFSIISGVLGVGLLTCLITAPGITSRIEAKLYKDIVIHSEQSKFQKIVVTRYKNDTRMYLNGHIQFCSLDEYRYHEAIVHPAMSLAPSRERILVLGGGDGLALREIWKYDDVKSVTLVDLDPKVVELCRNMHFITELNKKSLENPKLKILHQDALLFLQNDDKFYNVIIIDLPDPNSEVLNKLYTKFFYGLVKKRLGPTGIMVTQATSPLYAQKAFWCIHHTIESTGLRVQGYHTFIHSFGDWGFHIASASKKFKLQDAKIKVPARFINSQAIHNMLLFPKDTQEVKTEVNVITKPVLLKYYEEGWQAWHD